MASAEKPSSKPYARPSNAYQDACVISGKSIASHA